MWRITAEFSYPFLAYHSMWLIPQAFHDYVCLFIPYLPIVLCAEHHKIWQCFGSVFRILSKPFISISRLLYLSILPSLHFCTTETNVLNPSRRSRCLTSFREGAWRVVSSLAIRATVDCTNRKFYFCVT